MKKKAKKLALFYAAAIAVLTAVFGMTMAFVTDVELFLGLSYYVPVYGDPSGDAASAAANDTGKLSVHFVDVGQGDCAIIEFPDGKTMIIDGGENKKTVENQIDTFIEHNLPDDFAYFDYCVLTHPDSDHCGSLDYVLNKYPARISYRPNVEAGTSSSPYSDPGRDDLTADAVQKSTAVYAAAVKAMYTPTADIDFTPTVYVTDPSDESQTITGGAGDDAYSLVFYSPLSHNYGTKESNASWNDYSPIMILEYKGFKYAMSGDAEETNLGEFAAKVNAAKSDGVEDKYDAFDDNYCVNVIKAGHHGSRNATTLEYLQAITTDAGASGVQVVISCGEGNSYGHPHVEALQRYKDIGVPDENILRTDQKGDITFSVRLSANGNGVLFCGDTPVGRVKTGDKLEHKKAGGIELRWTWLAWAILAALVLLALLHIFISANDKSKRSERSERGRKTRGRK